MCRVISAAAARTSGPRRHSRRRKAEPETQHGMTNDESPSERWRRVERVYLSALSCQDSERSAVLDDLCRGDEALRREVVSLLRAQLAAGSFLDDGAMAVAAEIVRGELGTDQESRVDHHRVN